MKRSIEILPSILKRVDLSSDAKLVFSLLTHTTYEIWCGEMIIDGVYVPNKVHIERIMCILGLSKTKVFIAIRRLNKIGLVSVSL